MSRPTNGVVRELARKQDELAKSRDQLARVNAIVTAINSEHDLTSLLDALLRLMPIVKGKEKAAALIWDQEQRAYLVKASTGWQPSDLAGIKMSFEEAEARYVWGADEIFEDIFIARSEIGGDGHGADDEATTVQPWSMLTLRINVEDWIEGYLVFDRFEDDSDFGEHNLVVLRDLKEHIHSAFIKTRMMEELRTLNEKKNEFLGIAAHDLRNPLGLISAWSEVAIRLIKGGKVPPDEIVKLVQRVVRAADQMSRLVADLLDISAIEAGKLRLEPDRLSLAEVLADCEEMHAQVAEDKGIRLEITGTLGLPEVCADRARVLEVLDNLIGNAIKFTHAGGRVQVVCEVEADEVLTHVIDTGQGLTPDDIRGAFNTFGTLSARPTGGETSTGLGLAITKKIIEMHSGRVWVESEKGSGSTFSFSLPVW